MKSSYYYPEDSPWVRMDLDWSLLTNGLTPQHYLKGYQFYGKGEENSDVYVIEEGRVALSISSAGKDLRTIIILDKGCVFGNIELLDYMGNLFMAAVMSDEAKITTIPYSEFESKVDAHPQLLRNILLESSRINRILVKQLELINLRNAESRVAFYLLHMANEYYEISDHSDGRKLLTLQFTHQQLAEVACLSREAVSKVLSSFVKKGILRKGDKRYIILDQPALEKHVEL